MEWNRRLLKKTEAESGMALVEFVLIAFPLMLMLLGIIDVSHAFYVRHVITNAAGYGARDGAVYASTKPDAATIRQHVTAFLSGTGVTADSIDFPNGVQGATGTSFTVRITATKTWYVLNLFLSPTQITIQSTMRNE